MKDAIALDEIAAIGRIYLPLGAWVKAAVTSREEALVVECPTCRTTPGAFCVEGENRSPRKALHIERHSLAIERGARVRFIGGTRVHYDDDEAVAA